MSKNLVIVESPAKAKTIEKFLGKDYTVKSSIGHIRDLPRKSDRDKKKAKDLDEIVDGVGRDFEPVYVVSADKKKVVAELKREAKGKTVWLAADEDREGEAIAWHVCEVLGLDPKTTKRITYNAITKKALQNAIDNPTVIDQDLVNAQQARRVLDRLVGFELSPVLWRKIQGGLSAGRVQSVAVRIVVEREREIKSFEAGSIFKVIAEFNLEDNKKLKAELSKKFKSEEEAHGFLEDCKGADFTIESLEKKPAKKSPSAPFTTSTLQQEASRKLGSSVKQTMMLAQRLYEQGHITYMRTDSVNLSDEAMTQAAEAITAKYGAEFVNPRKFKSKSSGAQEAHEAIRPTDMGQSAPKIDDAKQARLYDLIWKRTLASQMADAKLEKTVATISISSREESFVATGEVLLFEGFLSVYIEGNDDDEEDEEDSKILPPLNEGQELDPNFINAKETFSRPPSRYTEASLVKKLEEMGIGRPSTYAPTISTIQDRQYIEKRGKDAQKRAAVNLLLKEEEIKKDVLNENFGAEKNKLFPTDIGNVVTDFLVKFFTDVIDYKFTVNVEDEFDKIASGKLEWKKMLGDFYGPFHETVEASGGISRQEASSQRELGKDPKSGKPVIARIGRFGPMIQIGLTEDEEKPKFASIPEGETIEDITLEVAMEQFKFPRVLGEYDGEEISVSLGRFGPYVKNGKLFASLKRRKPNDDEDAPHDEPGTVSLERAIELVEEKKEADKRKFVQSWEEEEIWLLRGPYGIYIKNGKANVRIPKTVEDPEKLTFEEIKEIIEKAPAPKKKAPAKKPAAKKKAPAKKTAAKKAPAKKKVAAKKA